MPNCRAERDSGGDGSYRYSAQEIEVEEEVYTRALQWSGNPYGNGNGLEMDGNGAQFVKMLWIGLDLGEGHQLKTTQ